MSAELVAAYRSTRYTVLDAVGEVVAEARVDEPSPAIDAVLEQHGATSGVFVTAWNPRSEPTADDVNAVAHARLADDVDALGLDALPHAGIGTDAAWHPEHGLLVLDLPEPEAIDLATSYGQNAIVVVERGRPARLVLTGVMSS